METKIKELCDQVRESAYAIHEYHGTGHLEKVYENALVHRFQIKKFVLSAKGRTSVVSKAVSLLLSFAPFAFFGG